MGLAVAGRKGGGGEEERVQEPMRAELALRLLFICFWS